MLSLSRWVGEPDANSTLCTPGQDIMEPEYPDGLWWGHQVGLTPLGLHWAQPSLPDSMEGVTVCVPSKHASHTALAATLRQSLLLWVHPSTVLQIWLHLFWAGLVTRLPKYLICTVCRCAGMHPRRTTGTAFVIFPLWVPQGWPITSRKVLEVPAQCWTFQLQCCSTWWATRMASEPKALQRGWQAHVSTETPARCTWPQLCCQMSFVLIFHTGQNNKTREPPMSYRKEKLVNSRKSALHQINLILSFKVKSTLFVSYCN